MVVLRADNFREEEEQQVVDLRETGQAVDIRGRLGRVRKAVRAIAGMAEAVRVLDAALAVMAATTEQMAEREISSGVEETISKVRAMLLRPAERIWRRSARKTRGASARRKISAPRRIISTRRMRLQEIGPGVLSSLRRRKRKL